MSLVFHWFLPTSGDGRGIVGRGHSIPLVGATAGSPEYATGARAVTRPPDIDYLGQIARSAEQLGFTGVLTPTGTWCEDAWLTTAALISQTKRLKFLVAFRPGFVVPTLAAHSRSHCAWPSASSRACFACSRVCSRACSRACFACSRTCRAWAHAASLACRACSR